MSDRLIANCTLPYRPSPFSLVMYHTLTANGFSVYKQVSMYLHCKTRELCVGMASSLPQSKRHCTVIKNMQKDKYASSDLCLHVTVQCTTYVNSNSCMHLKMFTSYAADNVNYMFILISKSSRFMCIIKGFKM